MTVRTLYVWLLRLHPQGFRQRFGDEMLWIFDQARGGRMNLLSDAVVSLFRQWFLRSDPGEPTPQPNGGPSFGVAVSSAPASRIMASGALGSALLFGVAGVLVMNGPERGVDTPPENMAARASASAIAATHKDSAAESAPATVSGVVRDAVTGEPLANAQVASFGPGWRVQTTTDRQGRYKLEGVPPGTRSVYALAPESESAWSLRWVGLGAGEDAAPVDFKVYPAASISGRVTDENNEPLEDIEVSAIERQYDVGETRYVRTAVARTNERGEYTIERSLQAGTAPVSLWFRQPQTQRLGISNVPLDPQQRKPAVQAVYYPNARRPEDASTLQLARGEQRENVDVRLKSGPSFCAEGVFDSQDATGSAHFFINPAQPSFGSGRSSSLSTRFTTGQIASGGRFRICDLAPGDYRMTIAAGRLSGPDSLGSTVFLIDDEDVKNLHIEAQPRVALPGRTVWASEPPTEPIDAEITVNLWPLHQTVGGLGRGATGVPGEFSVRSSIHVGQETADPLMDDYRVAATGLPDGVYVQDIKYGGESILHNALRLGSKPAATPLEVSLAHDGGLVLSRVVDSEGDPVADVTVVLIPKDAATHMDLANRRFAGQTNQNGEYVSPSLAPGEYFVLAVNDNFTDYTVETIAALFDARSRALTVTVGPNAVVKIDVEALPLER